MKNWLRNFFQNPEQNPEDSPGAPAQKLLEDEFQVTNELQALRLKRGEDQHTIERLTLEVQRLQQQQSDMIKSIIHNELEGLFTEMAAPASQIFTQSHLFETPGKSVGAQDILAVSRRLLRAMERHGVLFEYRVGETVQFDPGKQIPLTPGQVIDPGKPVIVRFCAVSYQGNVLQKAFVEQET